MALVKLSPFFLSALVLALLGVLHFYYATWVNPGASQDWRVFSWVYARYWWIGGIAMSVVSIVRHESAMATWFSVALLILLIVALTLHTIGSLLPPM
jgi:cell division protein FtsW (lipid II flippase)